MKANFTIFIKWNFRPLACLSAGIMIPFLHEDESQKYQLICMPSLRSFMS